MTSVKHRTEYPRCAAPRPRRPAAGAIRIVAWAITIASSAHAQPLGDWYGTMSNFAGPRQAHIINGVLSITPAVYDYESPIAVWHDVRTMGYFTGTDGAKYDLAGFPLGPTYTHPASLGDTYDGATDGTRNYTVEVGTGDVYSLDRNWQNPVFMFNVGHSSQGGIAYDCMTGTLWVANEGGCDASGQCGISGSVTNYKLDGTPISSTVFAAGSALLNDLAIDIDGTFWAHAGPLYQYDSSGTVLSTFSMNLGGDFIRGAEISCIPSPAGIALLSLAALAGTRGRARKPGLAPLRWCSNSQPNP
jgi:hypothetical protein